MTGLSSSGEAAVLAPLTTTAYVSLHTADPGNTGTSEVSGGGYARQGPITFASAGSNPTVASNSAILTYPAATASWGTISLFRHLDGGQRRDVPGLGRADDAEGGQFRRHGAVRRQRADHYRAVI